MSTLEILLITIVLSQNVGLLLAHTADKKSSGRHRKDMQLDAAEFVQCAEPARMRRDSFGESATAAMRRSR